MLASRGLLGDASLGPRLPQGRAGFLGRALRLGRRLGGPGDGLRGALAELGRLLPPGRPLEQIRGPQLALEQLRLLLLRLALERDLEGRPGALLLGQGGRRGVAGALGRCDAARGLLGALGAQGGKLFEGRFLHLRADDFTLVLEAETRGFFASGAARVEAFGRPSPARGALASLARAFLGAGSGRWR